MNKAKLKEILDSHKLWLETNGENGEKADFWGVDCFMADFQHVDLRGTNFDFSCWPLWCGSLDAIVDTRIAAQIAYHFCRLDCDDPDYISARNAIADFANKFHRIKKCGKIERIEEMLNIEIKAVRDAENEPKDAGTSKGPNN